MPQSLYLTIFKSETLKHQLEAKDMRDAGLVWGSL